MNRVRDAQCASCDYELTGLGQQGRCPECGQFFDMMTGEGLKAGGRSGDDEQASEKHRRGERVVRRLGVVFMLAMGLIVLVCGGVVALFAEDWRYPMATAGLIAVIFALSGLSWYLGEDTNRPFTGGG